MKRNIKILKNKQEIANFEIENGKIDLIIESEVGEDILQEYCINGVNLLAEQIKIVADSWNITYKNLRES